MDSTLKSNPKLIERPTVAVIDTSALRHNFAAIRSITSPDTGIMTVVKADGYGHGAIEAARLFESLGARLMGVALPAEGAELREAGVTVPIVVLGGVFPEQVDSLFRHDLTPVVYDIETIDTIDRRAKELNIVKKIHLKVDTGMGRLGARVQEPGEIEALLSHLRTTANIELEGLLSHFAETDNPDKTFSGSQLSLFRSAFEATHSYGFRPRYIHMANSAGIVGIKSSHFNLVRPGIMLYGAYPAPQFAGSINLRPALELKTRILQIKSVPKGTTISYNRTFTTKRESLIATLPIGYADGLPRALSSTGQLPHSLSHGGDVIVRGVKAPIAGTICMDLTMCDVTDIDGVEAGDEVVIIGSRGNKKIRAEDVAAKTGTISYEVFCSISKRVPRVYI